MQPDTEQAVRTPHQQLEPFKWRKGQSGNPKGRKKGVRDALAQSFIDDLYAMWKEAGPRILVAAAMRNPADIVNAVAKLVPKDFQVTVNPGTGFRELWEALANGKAPKPIVHEDE